MTYYIIYQVTNNLNGKIYIGSHKTKQIDDGYMGSGKYLKHAILKHGIDNFTKEILFVFDTPEAMYAKEAELVNEEFLAEANTYNLRVGGFGGFDYINNAGKNIYPGHTDQATKNLTQYQHLGAKWAADNPTEFSERVSKSQKLRYANGGTGSFAGKKHNDQTKKMIGIKNSKIQSGSGNSQFGTMWIHNVQEKKNTKIMNSTPIPEGWSKGRKMKF